MYESRTRAAKMAGGQRVDVEGGSRVAWRRQVVPLAPTGCTHDPHGEGVTNS